MPLHNNSKIAVKKEEQYFTRDMFKAYLGAVELGYNANRFLQMIDEYGGVGTAKKLLSTEEFVQEA